MKKLVFIITFGLLVCILSIQNFVLGATDKCEITIPNFKVTLNSVEVDNANRMYPLIVYKGITYFPLTYYDCRFLGLTTNWSAQDGLQISKERISCGYRDYLSSNKNKNSYLSTIPSFNIKINGKSINNSKEEYPLLLFRNVTYFPMTWRFCVDEFGWNYSYNNENGLVISSTNKNTKMLLASSHYFTNNIVSSTIYNDAIYYIVSDGGIYKKSFYTSENKKKVYQLPLISEDSNSKAKYYAEGILKNIDDEFYLITSVNNHKYYYKIDKNDNIEQVAKDTLFKSKNGTTVQISQYIPPGSNNIIVKNNGKDSFNIGNTEYYYGWSFGKGGGWYASDDLYIVDNYVYSLAIQDENAKESKIVKINMNTNETTVVSNMNVSKFELVNKYIYFIDEYKYLHKIHIDTLQETTINVSDWKEFKVFENNIYYVSKDSKLFIYGNDEPISKNAIVVDIYTSHGYIVCQFDENSTINDRMIVFNKENQVIFKCADIADGINISLDGILTYIEKSTKNIYQVKLTNL